MKSRLMRLAVSAIFALSPTLATQHATQAAPRAVAASGQRSAGLFTTAQRIAAPSILAPRTRARSRAFAGHLPPLAWPRSGSRRAASSGYVYTCQYSGSDCVVYDAQKGSILRVLTSASGLSNPQGTTVASNGNWYIANTGASNIPVYGAGGTTLIKTLGDPGNFPGDVATHASMVAVSNVISVSGGSPSVSVYVGGATSPNYALTDPTAAEGIGVAFDAAGNCYWSYNTAAGAGQVDEFPGCTGTPINLGITLGYAGGIAFDDAGNLNAVDQTGHVVDHFTGVGAPVTTIDPGFCGPTMISFSPTFAGMQVADACAGYAWALTYPGGVPTPPGRYQPAGGTSDPPIGVAYGPSPSTRVVKAALRKDAIFELRTLPAASCTLTPLGISGAQSLTVYADNGGVVQLHAKPHPPGGKATLDAVCTSAGQQTSERVTLLTQPGTSRVHARLPRGTVTTLARLLHTPLGFDPATAPTNALARYGFPPRPSNPQAAREWLRAVTEPGLVPSGAPVRMAQRMHAPMQRVRSFQSRIAPDSAVPENSTNWSGFALGSTSKSGPMMAVLGIWKVPYVDDFRGFCFCGRFEPSSTWVGLDGMFPSTDIVQDGTDQYAVHFLWWTVSWYDAWFEFYPDVPHFVLPVLPGDNVYAESSTFYLSGVLTGLFFLHDLTLQTIFYETEAIPVGATFSGSSAEWIVEGVAGNDLPDYGAVQLSDAWAIPTNGPIESYSQSPDFNITMVKGIDTLSTVAPINPPTTMLFTWHNYN
jgi:hypothetical protein